MCRTEICGICQHKSWTGCGKHVSEVMDITPKDIWCTCEPLDAEEAVFVEGHGSYPPKAGQGFRRGSSISPVQSK
ncbi:hypothetical protein PVL30_000877 [Lodderomyces elongisporus]|uniref:uncharacterized protein n=1 Tax=Lodderomyces elongisporus TaxID=36914 RepID=UPI00291FE54F|nr:uncharacterized protein PVL30_000877 [Lodderomyces elongisporus]WLF77168.1 hypothetical protein PVL30_000877 [Lodderomyces elongisporus]